MKYIITLGSNYFSGFYTFQGQKYAAWNNERTGVGPRYWKTMKGAEKAICDITVSFGDHEGIEDRIEISTVEDGEDGERRAYYKKTICVEVYLPIAVKARDEQEAKRLIESIKMEGRTVKILPGMIRERYNFEDDIPVEITKEEYGKTYLKAD